MAALCYTNSPAIQSSTIDRSIILYLYFFSPPILYYFIYVCKNKKKAFFLNRKKGKHMQMHRTSMNIQLHFLSIRSID